MELPPAVREYLAPDEAVLWTGRPRQGIRFYWIDAIQLPFLGLLAGGVLFLLKDLWPLGRGGASDVTLSLIVAAIALLLPAGIARYVAAQFVWDRNRRRDTSYVLTTRQAIITIGGTTPREHRVPLDSVRYLSSVTSRDGSGTIAFDRWWPEAPWNARELAFRGGFRQPSVAFEQIPDVRAVFALVQQAREAMVAAQPHGAERQAALHADAVATATTRRAPSFHR